MCARFVAMVAASVITVARAPARPMVEMRCSGRWTSSWIRMHETMVRQGAASEGLEATDPEAGAGHDHPFTPFDLAERGGRSGG